jgi:hypothetical protein
METAPRSFSLNYGGPFYHLLRRLHLVAPSGNVRVWWLAVFAWLPLAIGEGTRLLLGMAPDPTLYDLSVHVRLLFALPVMLLAERLTERTCRRAISSLHDGHFCEEHALDSIVARAERRRDAAWPEGMLLAIALGGGQLAMWRITGSTGLVHGDTEVGAFSYPRMWYVVIALPLAQFVMYRWLWHWAIWASMLFRISRLPLVAVATHPDRAAGLGILGRPIAGFAYFALAISAVLSSAWGTQLLAHRATVKSHLAALAVFVVLMIALAVAPLLLFCGQLFRIRLATLFAYSDFATDYARRFHRKWIEGGFGKQSLGSADIQSLSDLGNSFQVIDQTRLFAFGPRAIVAVLIASILPMIPLYASTLTLEQLLERVLGTVVKG